MEQGIEFRADEAFRDVVDRVTAIVFDASEGVWKADSQLDQFADNIYLKNPDGTLIHANEAYLRNFSPGGSPIGRSGQKFLEKTVVNVSKLTDELILGGSRMLEIEHVGRTADGRLFAMRTHKRNLAPLGNLGLAVLGITRLEEAIQEDEPVKRYDLSELYRIYNTLSESDREIARLIGLGVTGREIAEQLDMTGRTVELRKKKILDALSLEQTVDLIKLLVRLEDRGYLDLGL